SLPFFFRSLRFCLSPLPLLPLPFGFFLLLPLPFRCLASCFRLTLLLLGLLPPALAFHLNDGVGPIRGNAVLLAQRPCRFGVGLRCSPLHSLQGLPDQLAKPPFAFLAAILLALLLHALALFRLAPLPFNLCRIEGLQLL